MENLIYHGDPHRPAMLTLVVQAGGESRRMGSDKALFPFLGQPLIQRVLGRVAHLAEEIIVTTNNPPAYRFLGLPLVPDLLPGRGALGGLYTALSAAAQPLVAVVACDMPFVSPGLLVVERDRLLGADCDAVIPQAAGGAEPFHAVYRRETCLPAVERAIQADKWRVDSWFGEVSLCNLGEDEIRQHDPDGLAFWNVNTPQELAQAEQIAMTLEDSER
ncbi:MAG TPA: molybdenum cofactor guanylyltransferase [Anaerolineales bacterium]|nr:molybdenum cofactor guanylyltransferase [Anaerolineales bacterium]